MKNYFTLERFFLLYDHYAFIDVPEYYADQLFVSEMNSSILISHMSLSSAKSGSGIVRGSSLHCLN